MLKHPAVKKQFIFFTACQEKLLSCRAAPDCLWEQTGSECQAPTLPSHTHTSCMHRCTRMYRPHRSTADCVAASHADTNTSLSLERPLTHTLSSLSLSMLSGTKCYLRGDQSKAPSLLSEANTITTTYVPFVSVPTSAQSDHTLSPPRN